MSLPPLNSVLVVYVAVGIVGALLWDMADHGVLNGDVSVSAAILACAHRYPILPFLAGTLVAHLIWSQPPPK